MSIKIYLQDSDVFEDQYDYMQLMSEPDAISDEDQQQSFFLEGRGGGKGKGKGKRAADPNVPAGFGSGMQSFAMQDSFSCAVTEQGALKCWNTPAAPSAKVFTPDGFDSGCTAVSVGRILTCAAKADSVACWQTGRNATGEPFDAQVAVPDDIKDKKVKALSVRSKYLCAVVGDEEELKCFQQSSKFKNFNKNPTKLPEKLSVVQKNAVAVETHQLMIAAISKDNQFRAFNPKSGKTFGLSNATKMSACNKGVCVVAGEDKLSCYSAGFSRIRLPEELGSATDVSMDDKSVCVAVKDGGVKCWDYFNTTKTLETLGAAAAVKQLAAAPGKVCAVGSDGKLVCEAHDLGVSKVALPKEVESDAAQVGAGFNATAVVTKAGDLKFWFNQPRYTEDSVRTFPEQAGGQVAVNRTLMCATDSKKSLNCWRLALSSSKSLRTITPRAFRDGTESFSVGREQVCAISSKGDLGCWTQPGRSIKPIFVPKGVRKGAIDVATNNLQHCALMTAEKVTCWGIDGSKQGKERLYTADLEVAGAAQLAVGVEHFCAALKDGGLQCLSLTGGEAKVPAGLAGVSRVAAGRNMSCAIAKDKLQCFDLKGEKLKVPAAVEGGKVSDVSMSDSQICAVFDDSKVSCWLTEESSI